MYHYKELYNIINCEIEKINFSKTPHNLYEPIVYSLKVGGKRIRPILCLMASELFGGKIENTINTAIGIEIFHNFTLLHDDMMDNADTRRNLPTIHVKWNKNIALLSGDAMLIIAYKYIGGYSENLEDVLNVFSETALQICEGQQYDMDFETSLNISEADYIKMINLKTAVLLAASLKIGAILANASKTDCDNLSKFGQNIGIGFQLQDDLLDVYGDTVKFGKNIGGDIVSNKKTYLLIKALELAQGTEKTELLNWISRKEFNAEEKIAAIKKIYESLNIKGLVEKQITSYFNEACKYFDLINADTIKKESLKEFVESLKSRNY